MSVPQIIRPLVMGTKQKFLKTLKRHFICGGFDYFVEDNAERMFYRGLARCRKCILPWKHFEILHSCQILPLRPGTKGALDVIRNEDFQIRGKAALRCTLSPVLFLPFTFWQNFLGRTSLCFDIICAVKFPLERSQRRRIVV